MKKRIAIMAMLLTMVSYQTAFADSGVVNTASLRVRQKPSLSASIAGSLTKDTKINTLGKEGDFYKVSYKGKTGYVYKSYINIVKNTASTNIVKSVAGTSIGKYGQITASSLNVRSGAGSNYFVTGSLRLGSKVMLYENINGFYKIIYNGRTSYISASYVKVTNATSTTVVKSTSSSSPLNKAQYIANGQQYNTNINGNNLVSYSTKFLGMPYLYGGTTPAKFGANGKYVSGGFDCSGFVQSVYKNFGINLPRTTMTQIDKGASISINNLQKGDLVFFTTNTAMPYEVSHVGIYIGNNQFMHSPKPGDVIKISQLTNYFKDNFVIGKRIIS